MEPVVAAEIIDWFGTAERYQWLRLAAHLSQGVRPVCGAQPRGMPLLCITLVTFCARSTLIGSRHSSADKRLRRTLQSFREETRETALPRCDLPLHQVFDVVHLVIARKA